MPRVLLTCPVLANVFVAVVSSVGTPRLWKEKLLVYTANRKQGGSACPFVPLRVVSSAINNCSRKRRLHTLHATIKRIYYMSGK